MALEVGGSSKLKLKQNQLVEKPFLTMQLHTLFVSLAMMALEVGSVNVKGCGPQTKVCVADHTDAASNLQYQCTAASDGAKVRIGDAAKSLLKAKICGPGKFVFGPMSCPPPAGVGSNYNYKQVTYTNDANAVTTGCKEVSFQYGMACYHVEC